MAQAMSENTPRPRSDGGSVRNDHLDLFCGGVFIDSGRLTVYIGRDLLARGELTVLTHFLQHAPAFPDRKALF